MKLVTIARLGLLALLSCAAAAAAAETVYRCTGPDGATTFTDTPSGPSCVPRSYTVAPADPEAVAREERELEEWRREQDAEIMASEARIERRKAAEIAAVAQPAVVLPAWQSRWRWRRVVP